LRRDYALQFAPKAVRALRKVDRLVAERVRTATEALRTSRGLREQRCLLGCMGSGGSGLQVITECSIRSTMMSS
jgi:hypothetical protein